MSSAYSPDLRIELIGTGDQAGVWGNTTNNNLAYVIEQSVAGYISVGVASANQALTYINGGSAVPSDNQAVHASLALTRSLGVGDFAVYAPPASKQYTIYNASSYVATIYNSSVIGNTTNAGTGVAIPAGKTMTVWSDGTNFTQQNTHLISPTMSGTPTAPTATFGTSTTQVATTAFVQAAATALSTIYPVGSIYTSTVSTNPATLFGMGTWVAFGSGRVMIGDGGGFAAGATGGSANAIVVDHNHTFSATSGAMSANASHTHTATDSGHSHTYNNTQSSGDYDLSPGGNRLLRFYSGLSTGTGNANITNSSTNVDHTHSVSGTTASAGASGTNANLQPYVVVYMWNRTA